MVEEINGQIVHGMQWGPLDPVVVINDCDQKVVMDYGSAGSHECGFMRLRFCTQGLEKQGLFWVLEERM